MGFEVCWVSMTLSHHRSSSSSSVKSRGCDLYKSPLHGLLCHYHKLHKQSEREGDFNFSEYVYSAKSKTISLTSNLLSFIDSITPTVGLELLNKSSNVLITQSREFSDEPVESFSLGDLWKIYEEWGVFGVGVPIRLKNSQIVTLYYEPFLSGIQIFTNKPTYPKGNNVKDIDEVTESESDDLSRSSNDSSEDWDDISFDSGNDQDALWGLKDPCEYFYLEFFDTSSTYLRPPIMDKVVELTPGNLGLFNLRNTDLAPGSWMSVAWYPIYHIPSKGSVNELALASFLTFHTLSASFQDEYLANGGEVSEDVMTTGGKSNVDEASGEKIKVGGTLGGKTNFGSTHGRQSISLRPFGLVTYRLDREFWLKDASDCVKLVQLYSAADSWLKQLEVKKHHDFSFFSKHSPLDVCPCKF